ncbi:MAG TPA: sigma 54-interacting transcriptional regulator [Acidobacteriota bacterium]|nr:sigma 54-interacting transcriptional regulator [Acidobacteriota bacterium]HNU01959.1 sigma 54-interacting transcriptional regulator [Acidobacteriota bacterium]
MPTAIGSDAIIDAIQEAIVVVDREQRVVRANASALAMLGLRSEELLGRPCAEVVNCEACRDNCPFQRILNGGAAERQFNIRLDGPWGDAGRRICLTSNPVVDARGAVTGLVENIRDVGHLNELLRDKEELGRRARDERNRFQAILDSVPDGIYTIDTDWRITSFNREAERITGFAAAEAVGQYCYKILNSSLCQEACPLKRTLESGMPLHDVEGAVTNRNGETVRLLFSTAVFVEPGQAVSGGVESIRDLGVLRQLLAQAPGEDPETGLVAFDPRMAQIMALVQRIKDTDSTILITGESGTGKSLLAKEIHRLSPRRNRPFIKISCAALAETLLESELFGHVRGAFTGAVQDKPGKFEAADGGVVFLDEIGDVPPATQVKLLRFMQEQEFERVGSNRTIRVNVRIITATHRDLPRMVREGKFREDLYYRLAVIPIHLPALRERPGDLLGIVGKVSRELAGRLGQELKTISPDVLEVFSRYPWPGNIRELENVLEHGYACTAGKVITTDSLPLSLRTEAAEASSPRSWLPPAAGERERVLEALHRNKWKITAAAAALGCDRTTLWRKMKKFGLQRA